MEHSPLAWVLAPVATTLIAGLKGAFGGGFALLGIPLLALAMDPLEAGAMLAPLFLAMDVAAFRYWRPGTWSKPDLAVLIPGLALGVAIGTAIVALLARQHVALAMALVTLAFAAKYFIGGGEVRPRPRQPVRGVLAGTASGITTMLAHSGGPPLAMYLLPLGLPKALYAGTTSIYFTAANLLKVGPWLMAAPPTTETWWMMACCLPFCWLGVWGGWRLHQRLDQARLYWWCHLLLVATGLKLLWDGLAG
ncbi:sulfite exporter TauE/SafE family protein [Falsiroseomonas oryzae]|uniref:sulfite exporter TauE/SafE family protein n=1 Tax=Falsiroseomonas oryzae TaxID=2766473 RepID=UPI0022EA45E9|nr:sulfite exporter TauE/SafE family protein [Roseomonas sp. MO-31]